MSLMIKFLPLDVQLMAEASLSVRTNSCSINYTKELKCECSVCQVVFDTVVLQISSLQWLLLTMQKLQPKYMSSSDNCLVSVIVITIQCGQGFNRIMVCKVGVGSTYHQNFT